MATQAYIYDGSFIADAAIAQYRVVVAGGSKGHVKLPTAVDAANIIGVSQHSTSASGDTVLIRRAGITKVQVGSATITYGIPLRVWDIRGNVGEQNAGPGTGPWLSGDGVVGYAEEPSAASGDIIECWLAIRQLLA